jgi:hypothetical protein
MLKAELNINHNIRLGKYTKLLAFLKRKNAGYKPKKNENSIKTTGRQLSP